ncbi:unnamed protein product [Withania somnifera]
MEGMIPFVCKTIKRRKTLLKYESLSSGADSYNNIIEDFYPEYANSKDYGGGVENYQYRRTQSLHVNYAPEMNVSTQKDKQLVSRGHLKEKQGKRIGYLSMTSCL